MDEKEILHLQFYGRAHRGVTNAIDSDAEMVIIDDWSELDRALFMGLDIGSEDFTGLLPHAIEMRPEVDLREWIPPYIDPDEPRCKHGPKGGTAQRIAKRRARNKAARKARKRS